MKSPAMQQMNVMDLLRLHSEILTELKDRGVVRSKNNPTGDFAEWLTAKTLGLALEDNSAKGFDATDSKGNRYQIKGRRITDDNPSTQLGVIRNLDAHEFDYLIAVILNSDWTVLRVAQIPYEQIDSLASFREHQNGHVMHLRPSVFSCPGVLDLTNAFSIHGTQGFA